MIKLFGDATRLYNQEILLEGASRRSEEPKGVICILFYEAII